MRPLTALYRVIFGSDTDPALRPILGINFAGSLAGSTVWSFVGIWAIKKLGADQSVLGLAYLVSALIGVGSGYLGGHLSDHFGRRPLILIGWIGQTAVVLGFVAAGTSAAIVCASPASSRRRSTAMACGCCRRSWRTIR